MDKFASSKTMINNIGPQSWKCCGFVGSTHCFLAVLQDSTIAICQAMQQCYDVNSAVLVL
jgi:hypothetical protein